MTPTPPTPEQAKQLFAERERRIYDTVALKPVDRVPIIMFTMFWHARQAGMKATITVE